MSRQASDALPVATGLAVAGMTLAWLLHAARVVHYDPGTMGCFLAFLLFEASIGLCPGAVDKRRLGNAAPRAVFGRRARLWPQACAPPRPSRLEAAESLRSPR